MGRKVVSGMMLTVLLLSMSVFIYNVKTQDSDPPWLEANSLSVAGKIVFHSNRDSNFEIYSMDADGTDQQRLTSSPGDDLYAVWSPSGTKIAFTSERDGNLEIYSMDADGTDQQRLTQNVASDWVPDWSPDGKLVFASSRDGNSEIYAMDSDGGSQTRLTVNQVDDRDPVFSPDGSKIAFESSRDGNPEIYVMNADGTGVTRLTYSSAVDRQPDWILNKIVFTSSRNGNDEIYLMNSDGSSQTRLTSYWASDLDPVFSPDGSKIAFSSDRDGNREIYVMNADGRSPVRLTTSAGDDYRPDWRALEKMTKPAEGYIVGTRYRFDFNYLSADPTVSGDVGYRGHRGMDVNKLGILNPENLLTEEEKSAIVGAPVLSPANGKIVYVANTYTPQSSTTTGMPGKWLWIWHGDLVDLNGKTEMGISTRFLHLKEIPSWIVNSWQWGKEVDVEKGDLIGYLGDTGAEMVGPHLHFEIWQGGNSDFISNGQMGAIGSGKVLYNNREWPYWSLTDAGKQLTALNPLRFVDYTEKERLKISAISDCVDLEVVEPDGLTISKEINELSTRSWYSESGFIEDGNVSCDAITIEYQKRGNYLVTVTPEPGSLPEESYSLDVQTNGATIVLAEDVQIGDIPTEPYSFYSMGAQTIYIRADRSIDPPDAPISTADNVTYTLTSNIASAADGLVVERDNIVVEGAGFTVQGTRSPESIGIDLTVRTNVTINNAHIDYFDYGIWLNSSSDNTVSGNNITNNRRGIHFESSSYYNTVSGNNITNNTQGVYFDYSPGSSSYYNTVSGNNITNSTEEGINLYGFSSGGNNILGNKVTGNYRGILLNCWDSNNVCGNNITNNDMGIDISNSHGNNVSGNNITNNDYGCTVSSLLSSSNSISGNNMIGNRHRALWLWECSGTIVYGNNITNNNSGIYVLGSSGNIISGNNIANHVEDGIYLWDSSSHNSVCGNNMTNNKYGIVLVSSSTNNISGNNIANSTAGFYISDSSGNKISENNITNSKAYGIMLDSSSGNHVYHNSFISNVHQIWIVNSTNLWDDGYPSGGDYWSDYSGIDLKRGRYQNKTGSDGIGDTPYIIDVNNIDRYPLMSPYEYGSTPIFGDVNGDMEVNSEDLAMVAVAYGSTTEAPNWNPNCDINEDDTVDLFDLFYLGRDYGKTSP